MWKRTTVQVSALPSTWMGGEGWREEEEGEEGEREREGGL